VSFHWDRSNFPELQSTWAAYHRAVAALARTHIVIGHGHPKRRDLARNYRMMKIPYVPHFDEVCRRADVYVCDNSSTLFEFAATGRPVVVLNIPEYRRNVNHGLRFWDAATVGVNVDDPSGLLEGVRLALDDTPEQQAARETALSKVYAYRQGGAKRAADAIMAWAGIEQEVAA
jgi:UDP-N-acetylglucosamine:LPS N-acetylglucosamine transferase